METTIYTVDGKEFELQHHGVKGMKWGRRKAPIQPTRIGRRSRQIATTSDSRAVKQARRQKAKRALKIGAVVVGTTLAAYGTYRVAKAVKTRQAIRGQVAIDRMLESMRNAQKLNDDPSSPYYINPAHVKSRSIGVY